MTHSNSAYANRYALILTFIASLTIASCGEISSSEGAIETSKADKINELVQLYTDYEGFNGSILVAHEGEVLFKKGFGHADMEWEIANTTDTKFRIASITKPFTSMLIMQLVANGTLDLHTPISNYLPNYPKENGGRITIHHLLTHSSGTVRDYEDNIPLNKYPDRQRPARLIEEFSALPLEFSPGEKFAYSNSGFMVLGHLIETVTGQSYEEVLQENILTPLGMKNTGVDKRRPLLKHRAKGHFKGFGDYFNSDYVDMSNIPAVGNLYSTVEDMFLLDQGLYSETILPRKYIDLMFTEYIADGDYGGQHGYGWELINKSIGNTSGVVPTIGHSGSLNGFCALFTRIPETKSSIILLNNTRRAYLNAITTAVTGILNDTTYDFPRKPLAKFMSEVIASEGIHKGIQFYKDHRDESDYSVSENELIVAGYRLLHADNATDAAEVFKLSIEVFPDKDNPYDSYAEALMTLGKNEEAIKYYKKSLALNPNNQNAVRMLKKLAQ